MMRDPTSRSPRRGLAALLLLLPAAAAPGSAPWEAKSVHGYKIALAVEGILESAAPGTEPRHAQTLEHRLVVSVREEASGKAVPIASVSANVAESGYSGETIPLSRLFSGGDVLYEARLRLEVRTTYRILLYATPADGGGRTVEAQFDYRHHH